MDLRAGRVGLYISDLPGYNLLEVGVSPISQASNLRVGGSNPSDCAFLSYPKSQNFILKPFSHSDLRRF